MIYSLYNNILWTIRVRHAPPSSAANLSIIQQLHFQQYLHNPSFTFSISTSHNSTAIRFKYNIAFFSWMYLYLRTFASSCNDKHASEVAYSSCFGRRCFNFGIAPFHCLRGTFLVGILDVCTVLWSQNLTKLTCAGGCKMGTGSKSNRNIQGVTYWMYWSMRGPGHPELTRIWLIPESPGIKDFRIRTLD